MYGEFVEVPETCRPAGVTDLCPTAPGDRPRSNRGSVRDEHALLGRMDTPKHMKAPVAHGNQVGVKLGQGLFTAPLPLNLVSRKFSRNAKVAVRYLSVSGYRYSMLYG